MKNRIVSEVALSSGAIIGHGRPCFVVAEVGNNHQGKLEIAKEMVYAAAECGADAVKFQKRHTPSLLTQEGMAAPYTGPNSFGPTYGAHRDALELDIEEMAQIKDLSERLGLVFFASAWDMVSLRQMFGLGVELIKVASADLTCLPLLREIGRSGVPVIASTGMSNWDEIETAVAELRAFHDDIILLHCNSSYPCPEDEIALPVMHELKRRFGLPVGYSGHEEGLAPSLAAAAQGACLVERHFTLNKMLPGTDHKASLEPSQLKSLVGMIRDVERAMRETEKKVFPKEESSAKKLRKSIVAARLIPAGKIITAEDLTVKSPGTGISPLEWDAVIGQKAVREIKEDRLLDWDMVGHLHCVEKALKTA
ncbi:N-acetylneuraminic acid synthase domain-containing protein [Desulfovibrio sp. X2]|uniref:N-acetylneuraminate synthase family protein n=1 Tax=Desulfovibrio sp. X2 TaxID=941449 RepID=UPI0003589B9F|nr:N-acetylneuraminate synthase family protein [Desulfovibrio sp. X2]EPR43934.1 N-acetylneuraminic acid synthase domain-containing protein [Desulfovibrio sp. X2]